MNRCRAVLVSTALALMAGATTPAPAGASCAAVPGTPAQSLATAPVVFVGTVTATSDGDRSATVHVDELWRGPVLPAEVIVHGSPEVSAAATSVDRHYRSGQRYLFVPNSSGGSPFDDNSCSTTTEFTPALAAQRPASARTYPAAPTPPFGLALAAVVAAAIGLVGLAIWFRSRRPSDQGYKGQGH